MELDRVELDTPNLDGLESHTARHTADTLLRPFGSFTRELCATGTILAQVSEKEWEISLQHFRDFLTPSPP